MIFSGTHSQLAHLQVRLDRCIQHVLSAGAAGLPQCPQEVAELFAALMLAVVARLGDVVLAICDNTRDFRVLTAFEQALG